MLISFTGIDGCGKSTQLERLYSKLTKQGKNTYVSKAYGKQAKQDFSKIIPQLSDIARMFLFQSLHAQQYQSAITALNEGQIILADRWDESYIAYHSQFGYLADKGVLRAMLNTVAFNNWEPDLVIYLRLSPEAARERLSGREMDYFDTASIEYHQKMMNSYDEQSSKSNWLTIDALLSLDKIEVLIWNKVSHFF